jgi:hypothetical protein
MYCTVSRGLLVPSGRVGASYWGGATALAGVVEGCRGTPDKAEMLAACWWAWRVEEAIEMKDRKIRDIGLTRREF